MRQILDSLTRPFRRSSEPTYTRPDPEEIHATLAAHNVEDALQAAVETVLPDCPSQVYRNANMWPGRVLAFDPQAREADLTEEPNFLMAIATGTTSGPRTHRHTDVQARAIMVTAGDGKILIYTGHSVHETFEEGGYFISDQQSPFWPGSPAAIPEAIRQAIARVSNAD